jgi:hypothetical protein
MSKDNTPQTPEDVAYNEALNAPPTGLIGVRTPRTLPDFKERVKRGANAKLVLAEAEEYHRQRGTLHDYKHSNTYNWLKTKAYGQ